MSGFREDPELILSRVVVDPNSGCWNWAAGRDGNGYGAIKIKGRQWKAHRASYSIFKGDIPPGHFICHKCDNPPCVNPDHLFAGLPRDNTRDAWIKGRLAHGEKHYAAKLTSEQVREIYVSPAPQPSLAEKYGVNLQVIEGIKRGTKWKRTTRGLRRGTAEDRRLSEEQRRAIAAAPGSQKEIGKRFGISQSHVSRIKKRMANGTRN